MGAGALMAWVLDAEPAKANGWVLEPETQGVGDLALSSLKTAVATAPAKMLEDVKALPGKAKAVFNEVTSPSTALPLVVGGPASTVVRRLGAHAVGNMLETPSTSPAENLATATKGVFGDPTGDKPLLDKILSVATSPASMEALVPILGWAARVSPGGKARINEGQSQEVLDSIRRTNRVAAEAVDAAPVSPLQREPRTAAAIKRGFESGAVADASQQRFDATLNRVAQAAGNPTYASPALQEAYAMMPALEQRLLGPVGPGGFTLQQAQQIRSWVGDPAFAQSTLGQGVRRVPQQRLWGEITQEIEAPLQGRALQLWQANNHAYGGTMAMQDALTQGNAFQGQPNRTFLNRSALSDYLAKNEVDLVRRLGRQGYDDLVNGVLGGGQPGTRDLVAPGSGSSASAFMSWLRGTNTGSTQAARLPLTLGAPNIGSQYTGQAPYTLPPALQSILDVVMQKAGDRR